MLICQPNNPAGLTLQEAPLQRIPLGMVVPIINHHLISPQEAENEIDIGDQRHLSPQFPSPSPDCGFESNRSSLSMTSLMLSRSDRSDRSPMSQIREMAPRGWSLHEDKPPCLQGQGCQRHCNLPELEVGFNSVLMYRVQGPHPPALCN